MTERLRALAAGRVVEVREAAAVLRSVYFAVFAAQSLLALLLGTALARLVPGTGAAGAGSSVLGAVLLTAAILHLPVGWLLGRAAIRAGGRRSALSGTVSAAVLLSVPAWFAVLLLASGQRPLYLLGIVAVLAIAAGLGLPITRVAARCATTFEPAAEPEPPAESEPAAEPESAAEPEPAAGGRAPGRLGNERRAPREESLP